MNYFCDVKVQGKKNVERRIFIVLDNAQNSDKPNLTSEELALNSQYRAFLHDYKPKMVHVVYTVYSTEHEIYAKTFDEDFIKLIDNEKVKLVASGEMNMDTARTKIKGKKSSKLWVKLVALVGSIFIVFGALTLGLKLGKASVPNESVVVEEAVNIDNINSVDGMIIPDQEEVNNEIEQVTISIDRSYSATPQEDLKIKGELVDGVASITLPEFDRYDFFSHVPGYSYGFSTDPDSDKIQYYGGKTYPFSEDVKLYRVSVKYAGGSGTREDPYLIDYYDQLELMATEKARGYFKQIADIDFPYNTVHQSIDTVNELKEDPEKEKFVYDGGGYLISGLTAPLFGKVSGALIENVNIKNSVINTSEYKNYGFLVSEAYNYYYSVKNKNYETGETLIKHCTVSNASLNIEYPRVDNGDVQVISNDPVVPPNYVKYDENGNPINESPKVTQKAENAIGAISGLGGQIEDCYVFNVGLNCYIDQYFQYVGGISGKPANVVNSAVNTFSAKGKIFTAGGLVGSAAGMRKYNALGEELPQFYGGNIHGCTVYNVELTPEFSSGGLAGETSTNVQDALISNSYVYKANLQCGIVSNGAIVNEGLSGGVCGTDGQEKYGHKIINTVTPAKYNVIGNATKSKYTDVRLAPDYAFAQETILTVLNKNSIADNPGEILEGDFIIDSNLSDDYGNYAYPSTIKDLFEKTYN